MTRFASATAPLASRHLLTLLICAGGIRAATSIGGDIHQTPFHPSSNPYIVEQDAVVPAGASLVLPPGVVLMFKPFTGLQVDGSLTVNGTLDSPVVFTSTHDGKHGPATGQLPNPFDWNGVQISSQSGNVRLHHLQVRYGVYGINAQAPGIMLDNCLFMQNGQFHFKVAGELPYVQDRIPYSYNLSMRPAAAAAAGAAPLAPLSGAAHETPRSARIFRYTCLGAGLAGAGLGAVFAVRASKAADERDASAYNQSSWQQAEEKRQNATIGAIVSFCLSGVLLAGMAVTFAF